MIYRRHQKANVVVKHSSGILILLYASVKVGYNAAHNLQTSSWDTCHPLFRDQTIFYFRMGIVNRFRKKIVSAQRNVHIIQILCRVPPKKDFLYGNFCLCVETVMHVIDPFLQIKLWSWKALHI